MKIGKFRFVLLLICLSQVLNCTDSMKKENILTRFSSIDTSKEDNVLDPDELGYYCQSSDLKDKKNQLWIDQDVKLIDFVNELFNKDERIENLESKLSEWDKSIDSLGKDLDYLRYKYDTNYLTIEIKMVVHENEILELVIDYESFENLIKDYYYQEIAFPLMCEYGKLRYIGWDKERIEKYQRKYKENYWLIVKKGYRNRRYEAIDFFTYPIASEEFRYSMYHVKWHYMKEAMNHIRYFLMNEDQEALRQIMNSILPLGREFGAHGLKYLVKKGKIILNREEELELEEVLDNSSREILIGEDYSQWGEVPEELDLEQNFEKYLKEG